MGKIWKWLYDEGALEIKVGVNKLRISALTNLVILVSFILLFLIYKNSLYQYGAQVILIPMLLGVVTAVVLYLPHWNDQNYLIYYIVHPTKFVLTLVFIGSIFLVLLYLYAQCGQYSMQIGTACISKILSH